jgi:PTS system galactitol-specific IIC component
MQTAIDLFHALRENLDVSATAIVCIAVLGVCFGLPAGKAVRAGLTAGAGFIGLGLLFGVFEDVLVPAVQAMVESYGLPLGVIDLGEAPLAAIISASNIGALILPLGIAVNLLMLVTNTTRTINIDLLSYRYFAYTGIMVQSVAGSSVDGLIAAACNMIIVMIIADRMGPALEKHAGLHGISMPHGFAAAFAPVAFIANKIVDYLPGLNRPKADMDAIQKRLGLFGEPALIGLVLGFILVALSELGAVPVPTLLSDSLGAAVRVSAVFLLFPKTVSFLMEGVGALAGAAQTFLQKRFKNRGHIRIGTDALVGVGHPLVLTAALILAPACIFLAAILPGNRMLPFAGLAYIPYLLVSILPITGGAFFRSLLVGALTTVVMLYCGSGMTELFMRAATETESYANYMGNFSSICGANPLTLAFILPSRLHRTGIAIIAVVSIGLALENRGVIIKETKKSKTPEDL